MKTLKTTVLGISAIISLANCGGSGQSLASPPAAPVTTQAAPTLDAQVAGFWRLRTKGAADSNGVKAPRILAFSLDGSGAELVNFCDMKRSGFDAGNRYEFDGANLVVHFTDFKDPKHIRRNEVPTTAGEFGGVLSMPDANTLQIDDNITYVRFVPKKGQEGLDEICGK